MADASNRDGSMTNIFNGPVGNVANQAQDGASQHYNANGEAIAKQASCGIAPTQGNGTLAQADGEGLLTKMLGPAAVQAGKLGKFKALCWSLECFDATWGRASEILQKLGIDPKPIKLKLLKDLMDGATAEEEPELQELWANLIAAAAVDGGTHPSFADILSKLTAADARCLQAFERRGFSASDGSDNQVSLDNLERLGLCKKRIKLQSKERSRLRSLTGSPWRLSSPPRPSLLGPVVDDEPYRLIERLVITDLGHRFLAAVQGPQVSE